MPVTAKLSLRFYEKLGEDVAHELVEWFNQVDATYRSDLRELNELNFARFDAKLVQPTVELEAKLEQRIGGVGVGIAEVEAKLEQRIAGVEARLEQAVATLRGEMRAGFAEQRADLLRWIFIY